MKKKKLVIGLFILFICLLSLTIYTSFSSNIDTQEIVIKSMTPVYDETSTIEVDNNNVVFNDKNQVVKYNVVLENTQDYDVKISDIKLSTPTEEFLDYKVEGISKDDVLGANSTKELTVSFETMRIDGWGRNFADELTANISFEKVVKQEEVAPPTEDKEDEVEHPKEEVKVPEKPVDNTEELISKAEKIEIIRVTKDTIEFKETPKLENGDKIAVWLCSDPVFLGYFEVVEKDGTKQIVGLEEALKQANVKEGEHHIVLATEENETIGYVEVYVNENKNISSKLNNQDNNKEEQKDTENEDDGKVENPYTSNNGLVVVFGVATFITGIAIIFLCNKKVAKYTVFILMLGPAFTITNAEKVIELSIKSNVSFESQNVMKPSGLEYDAYNDEFLNELYGEDYWAYALQIKNFYIQNEIKEIDEYAYKFDVTEEQNGRVIAYLVERDDDSVCYNLDWEEDVCYDLYLQADGIIYPNEDASYYFAAMRDLDNIDNMSGIDISEVTSMRGMFNGAGENSEEFILDVSSFDTSNVTDMSNMFTYVGESNPNFTLDISSFDTSRVTNMSKMFYATGEDVEHFKLNLGDNFDTSNVTNMSYMFYGTGFSSTNFTLDLGDNFDTSNVTDMSEMFSVTGYNSPYFTLDVSNFDTSKVTDMSCMFHYTGYNNQNFTLDVSNFDTSNVTNMNCMFYGTGYNSENFTLDVSNFDTSNVINMSWMFTSAGYNSPYFTLDVSNFDTSNVIDMSSMFYYTGYESTNFTLDVSNFDTSNVTNMRAMFSSAGYNSPYFTLDVSNFDTSKVTDMSYMFSGTGYHSTKLITSITIRNPNTTSYGNMFNNVATKEGSQIKVNFTKENELLANKMLATVSEDSNVIMGVCTDCGEGYVPIGTEISIGDEKFNVISQTDDTITMLAQYNLSTEYKQSTTVNRVTFSNTDGWEYTPGPKEIDIQTWSTNPKIYVNEYVEYLKEKLGDDTITGDLITLKDLEELGCTVPSDYANGSGRWNCYNSLYGWMIANGQNWWTRSVNSPYSSSVWGVYTDGALSNNYYLNPNGVRPVITISKSALKEYLKA